MCGIAGILARTESATIQEKTFLRMISALRHRGPDESGVYLSTHVALANTRLSIIGIEGGTQPIGNEDGTLWIVFNGEAFNYVELKSELVEKGHRFATPTDTEVVLHLYEELGPDCLNRINGQFAFAIWDSSREELFLARDRVGIRPLHYYCDAHMFAFASEIKALFQHPDVPRTLDAESLAQVFTLWTTVTPRTIFRGIEELPPGHYMQVSKNKVRVERFWSLPARLMENRRVPSPGAAREELQALLTNAIRIRLRADVPVGAYLSGGLDSTLIAALTSRHFNNRLKTFSIGFEEERFDETRFQREAVQHLGTDHHWIFARNADIREYFPDVVWHCEKPLLRTAPVPLYLLSRAVRDQGFKVVLTGEGADEVFGGYNIFKETKIRRACALHPYSRLRPLLLGKLYPYILKNASPGQAYLEKFFAASIQGISDPVFSHRVRWRNSSRASSFFSNALQSALADSSPVQTVIDRLPSEFSNLDPLSQSQIIEMDVFMSNYLLASQGDRVAMAHSLELRMPFLDYRVIEFAMRLPPHWKIFGLTEKHFLRRTFADLLPAAVTHRPKQPYRAPIREAFPFKTPPDYVDDLLSESTVKRAGYFNPAKVAGLAKKVRAPTAVAAGETQDMAFLGILSTQLVHHQFVENFGVRDLEPIVPEKRIVITRNRSHSFDEATILSC
jgi:asparagine synthase (glutamine-hydrolysing)